MRDITKKYGFNAGKIWKTINQTGPIKEQELIKKTRLKKYDCYAAVGWLARENKIRKTGATYELGDTNLTDQIGENAGKIWNLLNVMKEANVSYITDNINTPTHHTYSALGWLARENKIEVQKDKSKPNALLVRLK